MSDEKDPIFRRVVQVSIGGLEGNTEVLLDDGSVLIGLTRVRVDQRGGPRFGEFILEGEIIGMPRS